MNVPSLRWWLASFFRVNEQIANHTAATAKNIRRNLIPKEIRLSDFFILHLHSHFFCIIYHQECHCPEKTCMNTGEVSMHAFDFLLHSVAGAHQAENPVPEGFLLCQIHLGIFQAGEGNDAFSFINPRVFQLWAATCSTHAWISLSGVCVIT